MGILILVSDFRPIGGKHITSQQRREIGPTRPATAFGANLRSTDPNTPSPMLVMLGIDLD